MASPLPPHVSAVQVGTYFVGQYYQILQTGKQFVHQFYYEASNMVRIDGDSTETATGMRQIHNLIMSLNYSGIEIKTAHSVDSWNGGVLVMISGCVSTGDYNTKRKFVQTFFLAPQEKGYFVLNDIFHFIDDDQSPHFPAAMIANGNYQAKLNVPNPTSEQVPEYVLGNEVLGNEGKPRDFGSSEFVDQVHAEDGEKVDKYRIPEQQYSIPEQQYSISEQQYSIPEQQFSSEQQYSIPEQQFSSEQQYSIPEQQFSSEQQYSIPEQQYSIPEQQYSMSENLRVSEPDDRDEHIVDEPVVSFPNTVNVVRDPPAPAEEQIGDPPKHTYASIVRTSKAQPMHTGSHGGPLSKAVPIASEWHQLQPSSAQQCFTSHSTGLEKSNMETTEEGSTYDEGDSKSVYVGNLPSTITVSDLEQEFKHFGRIRPDGVTVRSRKESDVFYAFIEYEDSNSVQNALKASPVNVKGWQVHVEGRRPNSGSRGRRGRGRGGYQSEATRGRFGGRSFGRGGVQDNSEREYISRPRGNGYTQRGLRQDRGILGNHFSKNGQALYEST